MNKQTEALKIGVAFEYKDGTKDWYDPVDEDEFDKNQTEFEYTIHNGICEYKVWKPNVVSVRKYKLCAGCGYEIDTRHSKDCEFNDD